MATNDPPAPARPLTRQERADLTSLAIPAHLATLDPAGFPRVIPIWFQRARRDLLPVQRATESPCAGLDSRSTCRALSYG
jgi:hypothetical protein